MLKKLFPQKKYIVLLSLIALFAVLFIVLKIIKPTEMLIRVFHYTINNPERINNLFYKQVILLFILSVAALLFTLLYNSPLYKKLTAFALKMFLLFLKLFSLNTLLVSSLLYLAVLFPLAIAHYDLGYDEAVYIEYARNFAHTAVVYINLNEQIALVDTIAMLPYYIASLPNFWFNFTDVWHFKLISSILSVIAMLALFRFSRLRYGKPAAVLFIFFLIIQPGFGFVASSYFGELLQAALLLYGFSCCLSDEKDLLSSKKLITASLLISFAIHTKFQLAFIVTFTMLALFLSSRNKGVLKLLGYTILFSAGLSLVRTIPVLLYDFSLARKLILITDIFAGPAYASFSVIIDKFQLFNKFFPLPLFLIISAAFYFYCKSLFERAVFYFSVITVSWWIFLYPLTTYRNPFMGIITLCLMAAILMSRAYEFYEMKYPDKKPAVKFIAGVSIIFLMIYGYSANLTYAYIGYNDGVQFDLDGFKNRLFTKPSQNTEQKDFYLNVNKYITPADTVYNGTWVAQYYLPNPVCTFDKMKESLQSVPGEKYMLVTRDFYPLGFDKIYSQIDSLGIKKRLIFKTGQHELYGITK